MSPIRLVSAMLVGVVLSMLTIHPMAGASPNLAAAGPLNCYDGDNLRPPYNVTDKCYVSSIDRNQQHVAVMTGGTEAGCNPVRRVTHTQRVRVTGDWVSVRKYLIRSISIRYVAGPRPWAYYSVEIIDGNGHSFDDRTWNNGGAPIWWDGAGRDEDNVTTIIPNAGFAPTFGREGLISIRIRPGFVNEKGWSPKDACFGEDIAVLLVEP